ncbi:MAG: metallophosphoesterase [Anaerocolumna sp.]
MADGFKFRGKKILILTITLALVILFFYWQNNDIVISNFEYSNDKIPQSFDGFKILQVSDLHNKQFGKNQENLIKKTKKIQPDIIVITGDLIDSNRTNIDIAMEYVKQAKNIAPVYYVTGNHEKRSSEYTDLSIQLIESGVVILDNQTILLKKGNETIALMGLGDPYPCTWSVIEEQIVNDTLDTTVKEVTGYFKILLSHRPELIELYANHEIDLVFSGHVHGGQFRIPLIGGLYAPGQGFFPKYTNGVIVNDNTTMIVSRGLGNSVIPVRIFNRPELVVLTMHGK